MSVADPEVICIDSDDDGENPPPDPGRIPTVSVLFREGGEIDLSKIITPQINYILANSPIGSKTGTSKELTNFPVNAGVPLALMRMGSSSANGTSPSPVNPTQSRIKHYGTVSHLTETIPISSNPTSFKRITAKLSQAGSPLRIPEIDLTVPSSFHSASVNASSTKLPENQSVFVFEASAPTTSGRLYNQAPNAHHFTFLCKFNDCKRRVRGNVNFVFHLWAHVTLSAEKIETYNENGVKLPMKGKTRPNLDLPRVECVSRCPECLVIFATPVLMLIHYTKCHSKLKQATSKSTCSICEKDMVTVENLREHLTQHRPMDAPYVCGGCPFRSNIRSSVIAHYAEKHRNTGLLMCPFCFFFINIGTSLRSSGNRNGTREGRKFAEHMSQHANKKKLACNLCACALGTTKKDLEAHKDHHRVDCSRGYEVKAVSAKKPLPPSKVQPEPVKCQACGKGSIWRIRQGVPCYDCKVKDFWKQVNDKFSMKPGRDGCSYACLHPECKMITTTSVRRIMTHFNITGHKFESFEEVDDSSEEDEEERVLPRSDQNIQLNKLKRQAALRRYKRTFEKMKNSALYLERQNNFENVIDGEQFRAKEENAALREQEKVARGSRDRADVISRFKQESIILPELPPMDEIASSTQQSESESIESESEEEDTEEENENEEEEEEATEEKFPVSIMKPMIERWEQDDDDEEEEEEEEGEEEGSPPPSKEGSAEIGEEGEREESDEEDEEPEERDSQEGEETEEDILGFGEVDPTALFEDEDKFFKSPSISGIMEKDASPDLERTSESKEEEGEEDEKMEEDEENDRQSVDKTMEDVEMSQGEESCEDDGLDSAAEEEIRRMERSARETEDEEYDEVDDYQDEEETEKEEAKGEKIEEEDGVIRLGDSPEAAGNGVDCL